MPKTVTLHCQLGDHDWERPSQRGRRPVNCPKHAAEARAEAAAEAAEAPRKPTSLPPEFEPFVDIIPINNREYKLRFIAQRILDASERLHREDGDIALLIDTGRKLLNNPWPGMPGIPDDLPTRPFRR